MAGINTHQTVFRDWEGLLSANKDKASLLPAAEPLRATLEAALTTCKGLKDRQDSLTGDKQRTTQDLQAAIVEGKEVARRLWAIVKGSLGTDNAQLVQFNMAPRRKRGPRKAKTPTVNPPPVTPQAGTATTTTTTPPKSTA
ncbi:MAG TPA: hypothetical protein VIA62_04525 [Thermoanaerobaculia bacterium]|jgi:hypothetical protein|nr:hypothetical protein [Thermoanaerobaculia bacterium]